MTAWWNLLPERCPTCGCWRRDPTAKPGAHCLCGAMALAPDEFTEIHQRIGFMHGYANGLSMACRANRHEECEGAGCVCPCHAGEDE